MKPFNQGLTARESPPGTATSKVAEREVSAESLLEVDVPSDLGAELDPATFQWTVDRFES